MRTPDCNPTHPTPCAHQNLMCGTRPTPHGRHPLPTLRLLTDLVCPPAAKPIKSASSPRQVRTPEPQSSPSLEPQQTPGARLGPIHLLIQFHCRSRRCHPPVLRLKLPTRPHHAKHLGFPPPDPQARALWFVQGIRPCPSRLPRGLTPSASPTITRLRVPSILPPANQVVSQHPMISRLASHPSSRLVGPTVPLYHCTTVPLYHCATVPSGAAATGTCLHLPRPWPTRRGPRQAWATGLALATHPPC